MVTRWDGTMCGADMDRIRDEMTEALAGVDPALDFEDRCEVIVAFVISARSGATLPALPEMIQNRPAADRLADLVYDEMESLGDDPDRLAFLFSTVSAIHLAAPDWFKAEEYLDAIWARITETWPDLTPAPFGPENRRDWEADTDILLLRRVGLSQTDGQPDADVKHAMMRKILSGVKDYHGLVAPFANALRTINALKRRNIRWPEFAAIERSMRAALREKPSLAGLEFVDV
jgi:hypothetical protein